MFEWIEGSLSLELARGKVGYLRCATDPNQWPGDVEWTCAIEMYDDMTCDVKIFNGKRKASIKEIRTVAMYLLSIGYTVSNWYRYRNGKKPKMVKINGR